MKAKLRMLIWVIALAMILPFQLQSQIPLKLSYQGLLLIDKDTPYPDSSYSITFKIYDAGQSGSQLWSETQTLSTVNGVFDAILGQVSPLNLPFDKQYWLGITVGQDPEFSPRVQLVSSPYSLRSDTAKFAVRADTANYIRGLTYDATGAVLSINGKQGKLFITGGKGVTIGGNGDTILIEIAQGISTITSSDSTISIRKSADSIDLSIANNAINSIHIRNNAIINSKIADSAITGNKINQMGAFIGQVLKWNGTTWAPANDNGDIYSAGKGISITGNVISNTGDADSTNDITIGSKAGGDLSGTFPNPDIGNGKVTNAKIADAAINAAKLDRMSANQGQVMKWNGTSWVASDDIGKNYKAGIGISISMDTIINTGDANGLDDITIGSIAGGDLSGFYPNPLIGQEKITTGKLANQAVTNQKLADTSITANKLGRMNANIGQVMKWDGTTWIASDDISRSFKAGKGILISNDTIINTGTGDSVKVYFAGSGITISNDTIINTSLVDTNNLITKNRISANGEVLGKFDSLYIKDGVITSAKLNSMGATTGQVLKWNGSAWQPQKDSVKLYFPGQGIAISNDTIINTGGSVDTNNLITKNRISTNGEVLGKFDSLYIKDGVVTAAKMSSMGATTGQVLKWNGTAWQPQKDSVKLYFPGQGITISNDTIINTGGSIDTNNLITKNRISANGEVLGKFDSLYIKDGAVRTSKLADSSVTAAKLNSMGATTGQVLKWNGTAWQPQKDSVKLYFPGQGIAISNDTIINTGGSVDTNNLITKNRISANGEVLGKFDSLYIKDGVVTTIKLSDKAVTTAKLQDSSVTAAKLNSMGATTGQVLKWNGTAWQPQKDSVKLYFPGQGIAISNDTIINTSTVDTNNLITKNRISVNGEVLGKFDSLYIKDGAVRTSKLADSSVTAAKLNSMGATTGQVLKWNGTAWQPQKDSVKLYFPGQGIAISNDTIINTSTVDTNNLITKNRISANGEVLGKFDSLYIKDGVVTTIKLADKAVTTAKLQDSSVTAAKLNNMGATTGQVLKWNGTAWQPQKDSVKLYFPGQGIAISNDTIINTSTVDTNNLITKNRISANGEVLGKFDSLYIKDGVVTTIKLSDKAVTTAKLQDSSVTAAKLNSMGATAGQILKWNGTSWITASDSVKLYFPGQGIAISNDTIINTSIVDTNNLITKNRISANGEVLGKFDSLYIKDGAVRTSKLADSSVTAAKLNSMGATAGQILKWNGTSWITASDSVKLYFPGQGIAISNDTIINTSIVDTNNLITKNRISANGEVLGKFDSLYIKDGAVRTSKLADSSVTAAKLNSMGATAGQILKWNGTSWITASDSVKLYFPGQGIAISNDTIINTSIVDTNNLITKNRISANGEVLGKFDSLYIKDGVVTTIKLSDKAVTTAKLQDSSVTAAKLNSMGATAGQILKWNGTSWITTSDSVKLYFPGQGIAISNDTIINTSIVDTNNLITKNRISANGEVLGKFDSLYIKDGVVTTIKLADKAVTTAKLQDSSVTAAKLNSMGATAGQILKWNGTAWVTASDSVKLYFPGQGIAISNDTIINTSIVDTNNLITKNRISANGEVLGKFDSLYIKDGVVTTIKLADKAVTTAKLQDSSVTAAKLNSMGATAGQILKWNGTSWVTASDSVKLYFPGQGIAISNDTIINTSIVDTNNLITKNRISANGEVLGKFDSLYIKDGAVRTAKLADSSVTAAKLNSMGATAGQILKWNGTAWVTASDSVKLYFPGQGIAISNDTIINTSIVDTNNLITKNRISANGEVLGKFDSLYIKDGVVTTIKLADKAVTTAKLQDSSVTAAKLNSMGATAGQILKWNGTSWVTASDSVKLYFPGQGIAISNDTIINTSIVDTNNLITKNRISANGEVLGKFDSLYIKDGVVTTIKLSDKAVTTAKLQDSSVTAAKLNSMGATAGQILKWNGTSWVTASDSVKLYFPGQGIAISNDTIINTSIVDTNNLITKNRISANGEVLGKFDSLYIKDGAVTTIKLADKAVTTAKLQDSSVTAAKLNSMGATAGQILKWNGTSWITASDSVKLYFPGQGIAISNDTIINTSIVDTNNLITKNRISANGEVLGKFDSLYIKDGAVRTSKLADSSVTAAKLNSMGATAGQILKWNGTSWITASDSVKLYFPGQGIAISNDTIINTSIVDTNNLITKNRISANGEVLGKFDSLYIKDGAVRTSKLADSSVTAAKLNSMGATTGQVLKWNGTAWQPQKDSVKLYFPGQGIAISNDTIINTSTVDTNNLITKNRISANGEVLGKFDSLYIKDGVVTTIKLSDKAVTTAKLQDSSVTAAKLNSMGATAGQILKWNGTSWVTASDSVKLYFPGQGIAISNDTIINTSIVDTNNLITKNRISANGEVLGKFDSLYIKDGAVRTAKLADSSVTAAKLNSMGATAGQILKWNGTAWVTASDSVKLYFPGQGIAISNDTIINTSIVDTNNLITKNRISANGEVLGKFDSLYIKDGVVTTIKLSDKAVTTAKLQDSSVTAAKLNSMGATAGQILKWNGTSWITASDSVKLYFPGQGIAISNDTIINTSIVDTNNLITKNRISANGEVLGKFDSLYIKDGAVRTSKLADSSVTAAKLNSMGATAGQILKWNGTSWITASDSVKLYFPGQGIAISNDTIINTSIVDTNNLITKNRISANGEVLGKFDSLYIKDGAVRTSKLADSSVTAAKLNSMGATAGQILKWNGTSWITASDSVKLYFPGQGIAISNDTIINTSIVDTNNLITKNRISANGEVLGKFDSLYIKDGVVTTIKLADKAVTTAKLQDSSVTAAKLNSMGATAGQILKWNGTSWVTASDSVKLYFPGQGIAISNDTIINTSIVDTNNLITKNRISANGEVLGKFDSLYIKDGVVRTSKLADSSVTAAKLNSMGATAGQILKWNGTSWITASDSVKLYFPGQGIAISNDTIINTSIVDTNNLITKNRISANGEVLGKFDSLYIKDGAVTTIKLADKAVTTAKLADSSVTAAKLNSMGATAGQILKWNGTSWITTSDSVKLYFPGQGIAISNDTIINTSIVDTNNLITKNRISANGEVLGKFDSLYIKDGAVRTAKLADSSVTAAKLNSMGATAGQILKWNGTAWVTASDSVKLYFPGQGIAISNDTIINTSIVDTNNLITKNRISANGEVLGKFDSLYIKDGVVTTIKLADKAVTTAKLADSSVTAAKLNSMGATAGQILKWNGTSWITASDSVKLYFPGQGIAISNDTIINTSIVDTNNLITKNRISANGEVLGKFDSLYIKDGVVTTIKLSDKAVTTAKLQDSSVTAAKLNSMGATAGQILKWNGTSWITASDSVKLYFPGQGIAISNDTIINTSIVDTNNLITKNRISANGEVLGKFDSLYIKDGVVTTIKLADKAVTTAKLQDSSVTAAKLNSMGATAGQILKWNGTAWVTASDSVKLYFPGQGIAISNDTIINTSIVDTNNLITKNRISANGEVLGKFDSLYIKDGAVRTSKLADSSVTAAKLSSMGATAGQILKWNGTSWVTASDSVKLYFPGQGIAISNDTIINTSIVDTNNLITKNRISVNGEVLGKFDSLYIKDGVVTTIKLADKAVTTAKLQDSSVTAAKLNSMGATAGQILKWNGTSWITTSDSVKLYFPGQGIAISNDTIINTSIVDTNNLITKNRISANGEVLGKFDSLYIKDGVVTTIKLSDKAVTTAKLADSSVTAAKLNSMGATAGQILKWNGTSWITTSDSVKLYFPGQGIAISNDTIINTSIVDTNNLITKNRISANGEVLGKFDSLYIKDGAVRTAKLADSSVTAAKLNSMGATAGQILKWNGTAWVTASDSVKLYFPGQGIAISNDTIINTSIVDTNNLITKNRISANGEVLGKFDSLYIKDGVVTTIKLSDKAVTTAKLADSSVTAAKLNSMGATAGQILKWNGTAWVTASDSVKLYFPGQGIAISNDTIINTSIVDTNNLITKNRISANGEVLGKFDSLYIKDGVVTTIKLSDKAVTTAKLQDSSVTAAKLNSMGATAGQILKWNGTSWITTSDSVKLYFPGQGIAISNDTIINTSIVDTNNLITKNRISANGEVLGKFDSLYIKDGAVRTSKLADSSVTAAKLSSMGATAGQILKWNGTSWVTASDSVKLYFPGQGIAISNDTIINTSIVDTNNLITKNRISANGEVLGKFDSLYIKDGAVRTSKLADTSVTGAKINRMGATTGQILKWNGTSWVAADDTTGKYFAGAGISISNDSIINIGDRDSSNDVTIDRISANGEVLGKFDSLYIKDGAVRTSKLADTSVTGAKINRMGATTGQILKWNGTSWVAADDTTGKYFAGAGISISNDSIINTGDQDSTDDVLETTQFGGEVSGVYSNLTINNGAVTTAKIADGAVTTEKLADGAVTAVKLNQMGASAGQILKWSGTAWVPSLDSGKVYTAGAGIKISNDSIINIGDRDSSNDVTIDRISANGEVLGKFDSLYIKDGAVRTSKLADTSVTGAKINRMGATTGQILKWNGTSWVAADDTTGKYFAGAGISISNDSIINTGDQDSTDDVLETTQFGGEVSGVYSNLTINNGAVTTAKIADGAVTTEKLADGAVTAVKLNQMGASAGQILKWSGTAWVPSLDSGKVYTAGAGIKISNDSIINTGDQDSTDDVLETTQFGGDVSGVYSNLTINNGAVTTAKIADGAVTTEKLADGAVTAVKLNQMGASAGQILKWSGTAWVPSLDSGKVYTAGAGIKISNDSIINTGDQDSTDDVLETTQFGGDVSGVYSNLTINNGAVTTAKIADGAVTTEKLADGAVTAVKLNQMGASAGQILKWSGTAWVPSLDSGKVYTAGAGIKISNDSIISTGDQDSTDDVLETTQFGGDVSGVYSNLTINNGAVTTAKIADGAVTTEKLADGAVTAVKLNQMGASAGQILKWSGTAWVPSLDSGKVYTAGAGIKISNDSIINTGDQDSTDDVLETTQFGGDVSGVYSNLTINNGAVTTAKIADGAVTTEKLADGAVTAVKLNQMGASAGQILKWSGTAWVPSLDSGKVYTAGAGIKISNDSIINTGDQDSTDDVLETTQFGGDVSGVYSNLTINNGAVTTAKIADGAVTTEKLADGAVTAVKLNQMGASAGQILKWSGTAWVPSLDSGKVYTAGAGIKISNDSIINTGDQDSTDDVLETTQFGGEVSGVYSNLTINNGAVTTAKIADGAVTTEKLADGAVTAVKLNQMGASAGQILKWSGTAWVPSLDSGKVYTAGAGIKISNDSIINTGDQDSTDDVLETTQFGGDVSGVYSNLTINNGAVTTAKIADGAVTTEKLADGAVTAVKLNQMGASAGQILKWSGTAWVPSLDSGKVYTAGAGIKISNDSIINTGDQDSTDDVLETTQFGGDVSGVYSNLTINNGAVTTAKIADGAVTTEKLADGAVTAVKLNQMGASAGQILKWSGTAWVPSLDSGKVYTAGAGIKISNDSIINTGDQDSTDDVLETTQFGGEVSGVYSNLTINNGAVTTAKIADGAVTAAKLDQMGAADGQVLKWNGTTWAPGNDGLLYFETVRNNTGTNASKPVHQLKVLGTETDIDIALSSKGTGAIVAQVPDGTVAGGNKRGNNAVDLQMVRTNAAQVAGGASSTISGGEKNATSVDYASIGGGSENTVGKIGGTIAGGTSNTIGGLQYSAILGGYGNTANGNRTAIGGGSENETDSEYSVVSGGYRNKARADRSAIFGGAELTLSGTATGSFGFNANRITGGFTDRAISITEANTGIFNNVDLWLTNNDNTTRTLRFYEAYNTAGEFPSGTNYVGFKAPSSISADVTWTLPSADGTANQVLKTNGSGILTWSNDNGTNYKAGPGIAISNDTIINMGDRDGSDDMPKTTEFYGDVIGEYSDLDSTVNLQLDLNSVGDAEIRDFSITEMDLGTLGATASGQVLRWDGTNWGAADPGILYFEATRSSTSPNNSIPAHMLSPLGSEANIDFVLQPKGNGSLIAAIPNSNRFGGNKRGQFAVDFQMERGTADQVAGADYSVIIGGDRNKITTGGSNAAILAGSGNDISGSSRNSSIITGGGNKVEGEYSSISAGRYDTIVGSYSFIGAGISNSVGASYSSITGGSRNRVQGIYSAIGGGDSNVILSSGKFTTISGGTFNIANNWYSNVSGGAINSALSEGSTVFGGVGLVLSSSSNNSFGFNANQVQLVSGELRYNKSMTINSPKTGVFNNVHLWLTNNDDTVRTLRFYEKYNQAGTFPNGANYVGFKAPNTMSSDVVYTLPSSAPTSDGQMLVANSAGTMSWSPGIVRASNIDVDPPSLDANGGSHSIAVTVTGAQVGGTVQVSPRAELDSGIIIGYARVSSLNTVSVRFVNTRNSAFNPPSVGLDISVIQP